MIWAPTPSGLNKLRNNYIMNKVTVLNKKGSKYYKTQAHSNARHARARTLSIKTGNHTPICKKDLDTFTTTFFSNKTSIPYSRLQPLSKLLVCQFVLHNHNNHMIGMPFVFRVALDQRDLSKESLNKMIQRRLSSCLNRPVLFWTTRENDGKNYDKTVTHLNGEILIYQHEFENVRQAFRDIYSHNQNKPTEAHDGTKPNKTMLPYAIRFPIAKRHKETAKHGEFYSVFNWVGYSTKQDQDRDRERFKCRIQKKPIPERENFHYIQSDLNKLASQFYSENILKKVS